MLHSPHPVYRDTWEESKTPGASGLGMGAFSGLRIDSEVLPGESDGSSEGRSLMPDAQLPLNLP